VIFGCVSQVGEQSANIARTALLSAGWPETIPGLTIDRKCGSAEAAVHVAIGPRSHRRMTDAVVAGGAENMSAGADGQQPGRPRRRPSAGWPQRTLRAHFGRAKPPNACATCGA
jgi:acetyl-CoA acetyltransferase